MTNVEPKPEKMPKNIRYTRKDISGRMNERPYMASFNHAGVTYNSKSFPTIREAQRAMDIKRLEIGLPPLLFKPK